MRSSSAILFSDLLLHITGTAGSCLLQNWLWFLLARQLVPNIYGTAEDVPGVESDLFPALGGSVEFCSILYRNV